MTIFHYDVDADGIATLTWDLPGKSMNVMTLEGLAELNDGLDKAFADEAVKGVVITSAKKDFAGGMDLNILAKMRDDLRWADEMRRYELPVLWKDDEPLFDSNRFTSL